MHQVGIGMVMTKVGQRGAVHHGAGRRTEATLENLGRIGSGHRAHGVERHGEASGDQRLDSPEVEQAFHEVGIGGDGIDDLNHHFAELPGT